MTPQLPPLPIIDGWLFIDNSFIEQLSTCQRQAEYSRLYKRKLASERSALNFGSAWHKAMEARYTHEGYDYVSGSTSNAMVAAAAKHLEANPQPEGDYRNLDHLCHMVDRYNTKYQSESFELLETENKGKIVEFAFATPLPSKFVYTVHGRDIPPYEVLIRIMYTGRIDLAIRDNDQIFTMDHKTTFLYGSSFWLDQQMTGQHVGYCWSLDQCIPGVETRGYIVNAACTRAMSKSRPEPDDDDFQRRKYFVEPERKAEWLFNTTKLIENFLYNYSEQYMPMTTKWCVGKYGSCQYLDVCSLPISQRLPMLQSGLYEDDKWSPLEQTK